MLEEKRWRECPDPDRLIRLFDRVLPRAEIGGGHLPGHRRAWRTLGPVSPTPGQLWVRGSAGCASAEARSRRRRCGTR